MVAETLAPVERNGSRKLSRPLVWSRPFSAACSFRRDAIPVLVGLYITAAYWFTASTSFANPAVAIARAFTNTFSGIRPIDLPGFIAAELAGALIALAVMSWLLSNTKQGRQA